MEIFVLLAFLAFYFLPISIAGMRNAANRTGIFWVNLLFGWTILGWIAALIWAVTEQPESAQPAPLNSDSLDQATSYFSDESLRQRIISLRDKGFSYYLIAQDFNEQKVTIPERHTEFQTWSPELVKLLNSED